MRSTVKHNFSCKLYSLIILNYSIMFCYILAQDMLSGKIVCKLNRMMLPYLNFFFFFLIGHYYESVWYFNLYN